ncbi:hypothetical protein WICPIJ_002838 [Wickerhamomyces pijperi]|uniref:UBC core domain-containing protein n=1 Tax=Wickerhamomyces pijperi TaxID=599730 RepID=A0A9P8Q8E6_WICPI|nr:hypothetical protein WICPIJ_002838 [Wickerhamomyces pijperi]
MSNLPKRIIKESERLISDPVPGITAVPHEDNLRYFDVTIQGPDQSPYEGGVFELELYLPDDYPNHWSPALQIRTILLSVQALLAAPNPNDPLANDVAEEWLQNETAAIETAKQWTSLHAQPKPAVAED